MADFIEELKTKNPGETEFHQAAEEFYHSVVPVLNKKPQYRSAKILERLSEPERVIMFRVPWIDDKGEIQVNRGYRIQMNSAIGPYKGGLRFHPSVNLSILKFLAFEQVFKNSLTTLPMGGGKGGSNFDPKGKSDNEVMAFCQSFMTELYRHVGADTDVPAGDIGVGGREIGYMFGQYKRITNQFTGILTGKGPNWGGSLIRPEATGYGVIYFANEMLQAKGDEFKGKKCIISGSGNVAQYAAQKLIELGAVVLTMSDSDGYIYDEQGINTEKLAYIMKLKNEDRGRISEYVEHYKSATFTANTAEQIENALWKTKADCAFPCATQNEVNEADANNLVAAGVKLLCEGANMPCTNPAIEILMAGGVAYAPGKATNAGGVATSGLEMTQNSQRLYWTSSEVDNKLHDIMKRIHKQCLDAGKAYGMEGNYQAGANIAGFIKVADSMLDQGIV
ncbi:MAG: NADP-specific glutamate dehydrogenase [Bacteroidota bacterium]|nr:NADP-specific glutamate dehydrogenase [Bacteroidota bacterium]